jgi:peptidoglycan/xylan/chitin deacetylase (PgdA/CDA1 family)
MKVSEPRALGAVLRGLSPAAASRSIRRGAEKRIRRLRCAWMRHSVCLIYHRVAALEADPHLLAVRPERFRQQLLYLRDNFRILTPLEMHQCLESGNVPADGIVITFDDGYADNYLNMLPIVEEVQVPVTVFVSTDLLGTSREFWWDELERIFMGEGGYPARLDFTGQQGSIGRATDTREARREACNQFHAFIKKLKPAEREYCLDSLRKWAGTCAEGQPSHRVLTLDELARLSRSPFVTIGAHSCSHTALSILTAEEQAAEMADSRRILEELTGRAVDFFSYPFGTRQDYSAETPELCRQLGFKGSYANFHGHIFRSTDPFQLPRMLVRDWDIDNFRRRLGAFLRG